MTTRPIRNGIWNRPYNVNLLRQIILELGYFAKGCVQLRDFTQSCHVANMRRTAALHVYQKVHHHEAPDHLIYGPVRALSKGKEFGMEFSRILFPVDLSKQCVDFAWSIRTIAERLQAHVTLLGVVELPPSWSMETSADESYGEMSLDEILTLYHQELEAFRERYFRNFDVDVVQAQGDPAAIICKYAEANAIDLITMPTHGRGPFRLALLGSVTAKVLHDARCCVWTASHTHNLAANPCPYETILCSVDAAERSVPLIEAAAALAVRLASRLVLVHTIRPRAGLRADECAAISIASEEAQIRARLAALQQMAGVKVPVCVARGEVADGVAQAAGHFGANLVVIGRGHVQQHKSPFQASVYWTICQSPCPVLCL